MFQLDNSKHGDILRSRLAKQIYAVRRKGLNQIKTRLTTSGNSAVTNLDMEGSDIADESTDNLTQNTMEGTAEGSAKGIEGGLMKGLPGAYQEVGGNDPIIPTRFFSQEKEGEMASDTLQDMTRSGDEHIALDHGLDEISGTSEELYPLNNVR